MSDKKERAPIINQDALNERVEETKQATKDAYASYKDKTTTAAEKANKVTKNAYGVAKEKTGAAAEKAIEVTKDAYVVAKDKTTAAASTAADKAKRVQIESEKWAAKMLAGASEALEKHAKKAEEKRKEQEKDTK